MGSTGSGSDCGAARRLDQIRGGAPGRPPSVRVLAGFSQNTACRLAALGFAAGVDFDRLLAGTRFRPAVVGPLRPPIEPTTGRSSAARGTCCGGAATAS